MNFHCGIIGDEEAQKRTLAFAENKEFFEDESLLSNIVPYQIKDFDTLDELAHKIRKESAIPEIPDVPRDGFIAIRPKFDPVYDHHVLKYWYLQQDAQRVISSFGVTGLCFIKKQEPAKKLEEKLPEFDADFSPDNPQNRAAAEARGLSYNTARKAYVDEDGCLIRDEFGQPL
jgi:hypothetical protein